MASSAPVAGANPASAGERVFQAALASALAALGFFLPFSTAGTSLALFVLLLLCVPAGRRVAQLAPWREPLIAIGLLLLAWLCLRTFTSAPGIKALAAANHYHELLMLPVVWALVRIARVPQVFFAGFVAGATVLAVAHWLTAAVTPLGPFLASRRISAGFGLAICAFLLYEQARVRLLPRTLCWPLAAFLALTVLFATDGRTGHVVLLLLAGCAAWRSAPRRWRWPAAVALMLVVALFSSMSQPMRERLMETLSVAEAAEKPTLTSTSIRVQLLRAGSAVAQENALIGTGLANYPDAFARAAATFAHEGPWTKGDNPHNEYLMQLGAGGIPALLLFLAWIGWPVVQRRRELPDAEPWAGLLACLAAAFAVGCIFNSLLLDFVEGHMYAAVAAWLLARRSTA